MRATVVVFPGDRLPPVEMAGETATVREVLAAANVTPPAPGEPVALAVNGNIITDLDAPVADGAIVTKTNNIKGA